MSRERIQLRKKLTLKANILAFAREQRMSWVEAKSVFNLKYKQYDNLFVR